MPDLIGRTLGHYRIVEKIGEGGMGEVYRAHDERLDRDVAIKVLHQDVSQDADRLARFEREAKAVAKLAHPNILEIWDFGTDEGVTYAVTELLEGQNLRQSIPASGMPWQKVVEIGGAIADGLAAAHGKGIVHRDLKPENVFVTSDGRVKILDFGLAQVKVPVEEEAETATLTPGGTVAGTIMGTVGYMAPEQVKGRSADHRSDVFALGCVLYEMVSGRRPFEGDTTVETMAAILKEEPPQLSSTGATLPGDLERTVHRCLEKSPDARFQSAADLAFGLRSIGTGPAVMMATPTGEVRPVTRKRRWWLAAAAVGIAVAAVVGWKLVDLQPAPGIPEVKHIAVLPFESTGDDPDGRFLAAGLAETVADGLSIVERETRGATWVERPSPDSTLEDARKEHNATIAVRGFFEPGEERVRLELQLVDTASGRTVARRTLDESVRNLANLQSEPVRMVWDMLGFQPTPPVLGELDSMATNTVTGCRSYLTGRGRLVLADSEEDLLAAAASLEQAVEENPGCVPPRVRLADAFARLFDMTGNQEWKERAIAEARHAIDVNGDSPEPYLVLGAVYGTAREGQLELEALRHAAHVSNTADAYLALGNAATDAEQYSEAEAALQTAINLRPDHIDPHHSLGYLYTQMGRYDAAENEFRHASDAAPANVMGHINLGAMLYVQGRRDEARRAFEDAVAAEPNEIAFSNLGGLYFEEARYGDATEMFEKAIACSGEDLTDSRYYLVGNLAGAQHWGGERDRARLSFQQAIELAEEFLAKHPDVASVMADLAGYHAMIGERDRGFELLEMATQSDIRDAYVMGTMAESFEDLGDRDRAVQWIETALGSGLDVEWIERRPSLNSLRQDDRFKALLKEHEVD